MFNRKPEPEYKYVAVRPCHCGGMSFSQSRFGDLFNCDKCGAVFVVSLMLLEPKLELREVEKE